MKCCLKERDLYDLASACPDRPRGKAAQHLDTCPRCARKVSDLSSLRSEVVCCMPVEEPDWADIDRVVNAAIVARGQVKEREFSWFPLGLAAAAGAFILLAVLAPNLDGIFSSPPTTEAPVVAVATPRPAPATTPQLSAVITDTVGVIENAPIGRSVASGFEASTERAQAVRLDLAGTTTVELGASSSFLLHSTGLDTPALELRGGDLSVSIPPGGLERPLVVLAGGSSFAIFTGFAEFDLQDDDLVVTVREGEVLPIATEPRLAPLTVGTWLGEEAEKGAKEWRPAQVKPEARTEVSGIAAMDSRVPQTEIRRPLGTLSKHAIREVVGKAKPRLTTCYESSLKRFPSLSESVSVTAKLNVSAKGQVTGVNLDGAKEWPELDRCLRNVFRGMVFPQPTGGSLELILPLRLSPRH